MERLFNLDLSTNYYLRRPTSSWVLCALTNAQVFVFELKDVPIGIPPEDIPDYTKKSKSIITMTRNRNNKPINENLCFFRCLVYHRNENKDKNSNEKATKQLLHTIKELIFHNFLK